MALIERKTNQDFNAAAINLICRQTLQIIKSLPKEAIINLLAIALDQAQFDTIKMVSENAMKYAENIEEIQNH